MKKIFLFLLSFLEKISRKAIVYYNQNTHNALGRTAAKSALGFWHVGNVFDSGDIAYGIANNGLVERDGTALVEYVIKYNMHAQRQFVLYDIGANTGYYSMLAAQVGGDEVRVFSFEPVKEHVECERESIKLNRFEDHVRVFELAVGESAGSATIHLAGSGTTLDQKFLGDANVPTRQVTVEPLDKIMEDGHLLAPQFIKIDVEGAELGVLKGAAHILAAHHPVIWYESAAKVSSLNFYNPHFRATQEYLAGLGYKIFRCGEHTLHPADEIPPDGVSMWLAVHADADAKFLEDVVANYEKIMAKSLAI